MKSQGHGKLRQREAETLKANGRGELGGERAPRVGKKQDMAATRGVNPFLKADFPARVSKRHEQGLPRCAPGFPSYDTGARPHMSYKLARSAKKANRRTRSMPPPRGSTPLHLRRNQWSRRRTAAQGACNRPAVIRPFISAATSGQGGEPPHKERTTAAVIRLSSPPQPAVKEVNRHSRSMQPPQGCAPPRLRCNRWSNLWHGGCWNLLSTRKGSQQG
jgi:hypothetical protein